MMGLDCTTLRNALIAQGLTIKDGADAHGLAYETVRGYLYRGKTPSLDTTCTLAARSGKPMRYRTAFGTVVIRPEDTPPPAAPAALPGRRAA